MNFSESQLKKGGKKFGQIFRANPDATPEELAQLMGESVEKINARLESRRNFIAANKAADEERRNRIVMLPAMDRETEKGVCFKMSFACEGYKSHRGDVDYEFWSVEVGVWFPKSQCAFVDGKWSVKGWLFDAKIQEMAEAVEAGRCARMGNWQVQKCTGLVDGEIVRWNTSGNVHDNKSPEAPVNRPTFS